MTTHRLKHTFSAGELSPVMDSRVDFKRHKDGCRVLLNAVCLPQGPTTSRSGTEFVYDITSIGINTAVTPRLVPFVYNNALAYVLIFLELTNGDKVMIAATTQASGIAGLVVYDNPPVAECPPWTPQSYVAGDIVALTLDATWDIENFDYVQAGNELYIAQSVLPPKILKYHGPECWERITPVFTDTPAGWVAGSYPEKVCIHDKRLVFASSENEPRSIWMTKANDWSSFNIQATPAADDAIIARLDSAQQNKIQWILSSQSIQIGTMGDEWTIKGYDNNVITTDNIKATAQTNEGSEPIKPMRIGMSTMFVAKHGRVVNEFVYDYTYDSFKTNDISILAPHVTNDYSIIDWSFQYTPHSIIWCIREDGTLLGLTYQRQHEVIGWHRHTTEGKFKAIATIPGPTREDDTWFIVERTIDGNTKFYLEKLADFFNPSDGVAYGRFLDSHVIYQGVPKQVFSAGEGAPHLANMAVSCLADGTVHPDIVIGNDGSFTLDDEYSHVIIGFPFIAEVRPLVADVASADEGTSLGRTQRVTKIVINLYASIGMWIGRDDQEDGEHEEEQPFRVPGDNMGEAIDLYSGWYSLDFPEGYDRDVNYFIRQKQPLPLTVRSVVDYVEVSE